VKVLFVSSGNNKQGVGNVVKNQGDSLETHPEITLLSYYTIKGRGIRGYLSNVIPLYKHLKNNEYNIIHAHYSLSALVVTLVSTRKLIVSLMGSDVYAKGVYRFIIRLFSNFLWKATIVKSKEMQIKLMLPNAVTIPNGVDLSRFEYIEKTTAQLMTGFDKSKTNIVFLADPNRREKNVILAEHAIKLLEDSNTALHIIYDIPHKNIREFLYAADILILTSLWEGSPNIIKEAMACNCPIVSTDVGDVKWLFGNTEGCYLTSFDPEDVAEKIRSALEFAASKGRTNGRERMIELGLDADTVSQKLVMVYKNVLKDAKQ